MKKNSKKNYKLNKTTESFKVLYLGKVIIPALHWKGARMIFPYTWNGHRRHAVVSFPKIKWDVKKI